MKLYFHSEANVGDQLNSWLWSSVMGTPVAKLKPEDSLFIGIGTILRASIPGDPVKKFVMGAGCGYEPPPRITSDWDVVMVRGHLTAKLLGLESRSVVTDPGVLVRDFYKKSPNAKDVGFMPHYASGILCDWNRLCDQAGLIFIDPSLGINNLMERLSHCKLLLTEAMHGAIMADALGIKWHAIKTRSSILAFKWRDWASSLGFRVQFSFLPPPYKSGLRGVVTKPFEPWLRRRLRQLADSPGFLSDRNALNQACEDLHGRIKQFCLDHSA